MKSLTMYMWILKEESKQKKDSLLIDFVLNPLSTIKRYFHIKHWIRTKTGHGVDP